MATRKKKAEEVVEEVKDEVVETVEEMDAELDDEMDEDYDDELDEDTSDVDEFLDALDELADGAAATFSVVVV